MNLQYTGTVNLIFLDILIFFACYIFLTFTRIKSVSHKLIASVLLFTAQVILSELLLGIFGILSPAKLLILNSLISSSLIVFCFINNKNIYSQLKTDLGIALGFLSHVKSPYVIFLLILIVLMSLWLLLASLMLPPRGFDDLTYHLPVIYEYILNQKLILLPVEYRFHVAFPMNAELLFLWPTILEGNLHFIGLVQLFYAYCGILVTYTLGRLLSISGENALTAGLLFFLTPVVLIQSGIAYIDLIIAVFFIISLYFAARFFKTGCKSCLCLAGISTGLVLGMKYTMILTVIILQILIFLGIRKNKTSFRNIIFYILLIVILSGYWYIRNIIELGNPIYPFSIIPSSDNFIRTDSFNIIFLFRKFVEILRRLFILDTGIGSLHGGFGLIFWGMALPCWFYFFIKSFFVRRIDKTIHIIVWSQFIVGFIYFMLSPLEIFFRFPRHSIFIIPIGMMAVSMMIEKFNANRIYRHSMLIGCCVFSFMSLFQVAKSRIPSYSVDIPVYDLMAKKHYSQFRYLRLASSSMAFLYETLDFITLNHPQGLDVYFANSILDYSAPVYGSRLQNRVWNFKQDKSNPPDAFMLLLDDSKQTRFYGQKITVDELTRDDKYQIIDLAQGTYLFVDRNILNNDKSMKDSLLKHYRNYYEPEIRYAENAESQLDKNVPVVTSTFFGVGFLYENLAGKIDNPVHLVPVNKEGEYASHKGFNRFYTIGMKAEGYRHKRLSLNGTGESNHEIYLNY